MPIFVAIAGILLLLFLVIRLKLQAFVALLLVSFLVGVAAGMPLEKVLQSIRNGMGDTSRWWWDWGQCSAKCWKFPAAWNAWRRD